MMRKADAVPDEPPMPRLGDPPPRLGWVPVKLADKQQCVCCNRRVWHGIRHVNDEGSPPERVMCTFCYRAIMAEPGPGGWAPNGSYPIWSGLPEGFDGEE